MNAARFLETRKPAWQRLEDLLKKTPRKGLSALSEDELHELTRLYPAVAVDVARARMLKMDSQTQERLNTLAIAAHGLLYRRKHVRPLRAIGRFFARDYPCLFRRMSAYVLLSVAMFIVSSLGAYVSVRIDPPKAYVFVPSGLDVTDSGNVTAEDVSQRYRRMPGSLMAGLITTNNIQVAFLAFALGISAGIGTCWVLMTNGMMLGGFFGHFANHGLAFPCYAFLTPHGALEIFAILVSGAAGLRLGLSLAIPGTQTRLGSLKSGAQQAVLLVLGTIPMFIVAGCIESFITPSYLPDILKIVIGLLVLGTTLAYLLLVGRGAETSQRS